MKRLARSFRGVVRGSSGPALAVLAGTATAQSYAPSGVQTNVPEGTVAGGGWSVCHSETYAGSNTPVADILAACDRPQVMLACRPVGNPDYTLLAQAPRGDVFYDTGATNNTRDANGVGWYFSLGSGGGGSLFHLPPLVSSWR